VVGSCPRIHAGRPYAQSGQLPPWQSADVGAVGTPGHVVQGSDLRAAGAGKHFGAPKTAFCTSIKPIRDGSITADVDSETNTSPFAKTGVMIRQTLDPGSPEVILDVKPDGGIEFMTRSSQGAQTISSPEGLCT